MTQLIECVPNFSEGCDAEIIVQIANQIRSVKGVKLLNIDPGKAANRTVYTFAGTPEKVTSAAFLAIKKASELIDMRNQKGEHPRIGATDVCPLIPLSGISMEETAVYAKKLGERVGNELNIPVYLYEEAQENKERSNLAVIRKGEYEGLFEKIKLPDWKPDYGPIENFEQAGATVIGARDFLIAYNINLNSTSVQVAKKIAGLVRESGTTIKGINDKLIHTPGSLTAVKAIGWFIKEYGKAQISMNLTNIKTTALHTVFDEVCSKAKDLGVEVSGSELIGLTPLQTLVDAGKHYQKAGAKNDNLTENELIKIAVNKLGLDELSTFQPQERIIEYLLKIS